MCKRRYGLVNSGRSWVGQQVKVSQITICMMAAVYVFSHWLLGLRRINRRTALPCDLWSLRCRNGTYRVHAQITELMMLILRISAVPPKSQSPDLTPDMKGHGRSRSPQTAERQAHLTQHSRSILAASSLSLLDKIHTHIIIKHTAHIKTATHTVHFPRSTSCDFFVQADVRLPKNTRIICNAQLLIPPSLVMCRHPNSIIVWVGPLHCGTTHQHQVVVHLHTHMYMHACIAFMYVRIYLDRQLESNVVHVNSTSTKCWLYTKCAHSCISHTMDEPAP